MRQGRATVPCPAVSFRKITLATSRAQEIIYLLDEAILAKQHVAKDLIQQHHRLQKKVLKKAKKATTHPRNSGTTIIAKLKKKATRAFSKYIMDGNKSGLNQITSILRSYERKRDLSQKNGDQEKADYWQAIIDSVNEHLALLVNGEQV